MTTVGEGKAADLAALHTKYRATNKDSASE